MEGERCTSVSGWTCNTPALKQTKLQGDIEYLYIKLLKSVADCHMLDMFLYSWL